MGGLIVAWLVVSILIAGGLAACTRSWGKRIAILILFPIISTGAFLAVLVELLMHGYFGGL